MELTCSYNNYTVFLVISAAPWLMKVSIPETFKQTLKDMPTKVKGPIKKKKKTIAALRLVNYTCNSFIKLTPALACKADQLKNHTTEGKWERKNV